MVFSPFEVTPPHLAYTFLGAFVVIFGLFSSFIREKLRLGEAPVATVFGIIIGPHVLGLFDPYSWGGEGDEITNEITLEVTRVVIALSVFAVGVELPKKYVLKHWRTLVFLLGPCMIWGWMITALLIWGLLPDHNFLSSLVIAACVTPTDPILAQAVIGGKFAEKHVPAHVRHMLAAESGCNDGAAFPFLYIAIYLLLDASPGHAVGEWIYHSIAYEVLLGIIIGALLGYAARKTMKFAERKGLIDVQSYVAQYVSLAILSIGISTLLGSDDLLSAFACGSAFAWDGFFNKATEDSAFSNVIDLLFNCAAFIYIGALIPFADFNDASIGLDAWRLVVLTILVLLLRRIPIILATYKWIPDIKTFREAMFTGWFGPMGVGAIFISTLAKLALPEGDAERDTQRVDNLKRTIIPIVSFLVLSSIATHGLSISFFSLGRRVHSITNTLSRAPSTRVNEPAWTTHARRVLPGQLIRVNRDDDPEEGDLGVQRRETKNDSANREKLSKTSSTEDSGESGGSSNTRTNGESIEMREREKTGRFSPHDTRHGATEKEREQDEEERAGAGRRTPPLEEYREGMDLIVERRRGSDAEVEVEVLKNYYHEHAETETQRFHHPHSLKDEAHLVQHYLSQSVSAAMAMGTPQHKNQQPPLSRTSSRRSTASRHTLQSRPQSRQSQRSTRGHDGDRDQSSPEGLKIIHIDPARIRREPKPTLRQRLFGRFGGGGSSGGDSSRRATQHEAEEGRADSRHGSDDDEEEEAYIRRGNYEVKPPPPEIVEPESILSPAPSNPSDPNLLLERTATARSIRFTPDTAEPSDTVPAPPGRGNYGLAAPGFKRNPTLSLDRTRSYHEEEEEEQDDDGGNGPSVSFKVPDKRR